MEPVLTVNEKNYENSGTVYCSKHAWFFLSSTDYRSLVKPLCCLKKTQILKSSTVFYCCCDTIVTLEGDKGLLQALTYK